MEQQRDDKGVGGSETAAVRRTDGSSGGGLSFSAFLFFILFALPGTPKDLLCYFAGLTDMGLLEWAVICSLGRLPSIITSTIGGSALGEKNYAAAAVTFGVTLCLSALGLIIYRMVCEKRKKDGGGEDEAGEDA